MDWFCEKILFEQAVIQSIKTKRIYILIGLLCQFPFIFLIDIHFVSGDVLTRLIELRFMIVSGMALCYLTTFFKKAQKYEQIIMVSAALIPMLGSIVVLSISPPGTQMHDEYFDVLIICFCLAPVIVELNMYLSFFLILVSIAFYNSINYPSFYESNVELTAILNANLIFIISGTFSILLRKFHRDIIIESSHRKHLIEEEKKKAENINNELIKVNNFKNKLLSVMAHDIRGPLYSTKSFLSLYESGVLGEHDVKSVASSTISSVNSTLALLDSILSWSRTEISSDQNFQAVAIRELVKEVCTLYHPFAMPKKIMLLNQVDTEVFFNTDGGILHLVLRNVINNAIKYTDGGMITVYHEMKDGGLRISVSDTGVGMTNEKIESILNSDKIITTRGTKNERGTGLGLHLCRDYISRLGGSIAIRSQVNFGTTVTIWIPEIHLFEKKDETVILQNAV